tara:strand:- start:564 stop:1445 length:882 start_codon:yes stop_codon:yes gene_type:complete
MKNIKQGLFIFIFKAISMVFCLMPRTISLFIGKQIGIITYMLAIRKNVAKKNISIAFKDLNKNQQKSILLNCYKHFGMILIDFLRQQKINKKNLGQYFVINKKYKDILNQSNGGCIMSAHIGNWEYILPFMGFNNYPMETVIKEQSNPAANKFYIQTRTFPNIGLIWKKNALKNLYRAIENKKFIGLASDQNAGAKGIKISFFDKKSSFPKGAGIFYNRMQCDVLIVLCIMGSDYKYHIFVKKVIINNNNKTEEEIIEEINSLYADVLENKIRQYPHQYFWFHKKWSKKIYKS